MNDNDIYPEDPTIDRDDVEGHGLQELAAGLGAAAVLAGGAAGDNVFAPSLRSIRLELARTTAAPLPGQGSGADPLAEDTRFELVRGCPQHAFQACAIGQLGESSADQSTGPERGCRPQHYSDARPLVRRPSR
ncbi:MAG: hypothetical protein JWO22_1580 [Frankiales bacterium]|nr:hypothetical protein [Frankiales bacterium]